MKIVFSAVVAMLVAPSSALAMEITREECESQGGQVVADTGDVGVFDPLYRCPNSNEPPTDFVIPPEGESWPEHVEVCCGGTGGELFDDDFFDGMDYDWSLTPAGCAEMEGTVVQDSGDGAVYEWDYVCASNGFAPAGNVTAVEGSEDLIGVCCLEPWTLTRTECSEYEGNVVEDTGNGAVYKMDYLCESDGFPPVGNVTADGSSALIGVCCLEPWVLTREECTEMMLGEVVVDSGDGAIFAPGYVCESDGYPPIGQVALQEGAEPTAVCCLGPDSFEGVGDDAQALQAMPTKALKALVEVKKMKSKALTKAHHGGKRA